MYNCELISIKRKGSGDGSLLSDVSSVNAAMERNGVRLDGISELTSDPKKLARYVSDKLNNSKTDMFIFANAVGSDAEGSFRKTFYELITSLENGVKSDEEHKDLHPKIKVSALSDLGNDSKGYCFSFGGKRFIALPDASLTGKDNVTLLSDALEQSDKIFDERREKYPEGIVYVNDKGEEADADVNRSVQTDQLKPVQKEGFFRSFIPWKGDSKKQITRKVVVLVALVAFIGALIYVLDFFIFGPMQNNAITGEIQEIAYRSEDPDQPKDESLPEQDWDALKEINDEIVGWITIPDTVIDYPVLEHEGDDRYNQYYLKRTYKGDYSEYGSIFIDYRSTDSTKSRNVIMHGHDMNDGSMFAGMLKYTPKGDLKGKLDYYRDHPVITFNTPDGDAKYKIISVFKTSTRYEHGEFFNYMQGEFNSDAEFMNFVYNVRIRSMFDIPVTCNEGDQIITLSTCCYEFYEWRCVIVARKVRPGEDPNVDVDLAEYNPSPLFPDVYYERYGGTRPDMGTFKSANAKGKIDWYDGKGNLEGSEDLTATMASNPTEPPTEKPKPGATQPTEPESVTFFPVTFRNYDGSQFAAYNVKEGDPVPFPDGTPTVPPEDDFYTYTFTGWDLSIQGVNFKELNVGLDIYPKFDAIPKQ